jgi:hypothetical protein
VPSHNTDEDDNDNDDIYIPNSITVLGITSGAVRNGVFAGYTTDLKSTVLIDNANNEYGAV